MTKRSKYITSLILLLVILGVGGFFIYSRMSGNTNTTPEKDVPVYTPEGEVAQQVEDPEVVESSPNTSGTSSQAESSTPAVNNSDAAATLKPTQEMEKVIEKNSGDLNNTEVIDQMAESYPSNLIPLYKAKSAADSSDIVTENGKPGWTAQYGSDSTVTEISAFYKSLLADSSGYKTEAKEDTESIVGNVDDCYVQVTVTPNNPERTGLNDQSNVDIFIEKR